MKKQSGITLVEVLIVVALIAALLAAAFPILQGIQKNAAIAVATKNLQSLVAANLSYAAGNQGQFCPATSADNLTRWHGGRKSKSSPFDPAEGFLSPYLGESGNVLDCPLFRQMIKAGDIETDGSWELGSGGFGYNQVYIGGTSRDFRIPATTAQVTSRTVMFASTALAKGKKLQEYPFTEPYQWVSATGRLSGDLQPSTHFRYGGRALIGWSDGSVTLEKRNSHRGTNFYGGDNDGQNVGWFGPRHQNGYWNPDFDLFSSPE